MSPALATALVAALVAALALAGCGGALRSWDVGPSGLARPDEELRTLLARGRADSALFALQKGDLRPGDELLRLQVRGLVAHYAGRPEESDRALRRAAELAEERYTRSLSRGALALITSDRTLRYTAPRTERLFLHYYGLLNRLRDGDPEGAAVEARRLSHLLALHLDENGGEPPPAWRSLHATLRYLAGAAFQAAGERNDAEVAYRLAASAMGAGGRPGLFGPDGAPPTLPPADSGDVLVVVERGFAPHKVGRSFHLLLWPDEVERLRGEGVEDEERNAFALALAERLVAGEALAEGRGLRPVGRRAGRRAAGRRRGTPFLLRVAWPALAQARLPPLPRLAAAALGPGLEGVVGAATPAAGSGLPAGDAAGVPAAASGLTGTRLAPGQADATGTHAASGGARAPARLRATPAWRADLAAAVRAEHGAALPAIAARAIVRAVAKYAVVKKLEEEAREESEVLGDVTAVVANAGAALLERADTRSWHLLPGELSLVRLRLPTGRASVRLEGASVGARGAESDGAPAGRVGTRVAESDGIELGPVTVAPGGVSVVSGRVWR